MKKIYCYIAKQIYPLDYKILESKVTDIMSKYDVPDLRIKLFLLEHLLISGEDHRFRFHIGFDILSIFRAFSNNLLKGKKEGASTISQQLVRVLIDDYEYSFYRKIKEIVLAISVECMIPKRNIPVCYLLVAYYGTNHIGLISIIKEFGIDSLENISLEKAAVIISRIKYPLNTRIKHYKRIEQIESRSIHLISLYNKHRNRIRFSPYFKI